MEVAEDGTMHVPELLVKLTKLECTDVGNGDRFVLRFGDRFKFVRGKGWRWFDGTRYIALGARDQALEAAKDVAQRIIEEVPIALHLSLGRKDRHDWAHRSQSTPRLQAMLSCARTRLLADPKDFDVDRLAIGAPNGVIQFHKPIAGGITTVGLRAAKPEDLITRQVAVPYDPEATAPMWEAHLARVQPDPEMRRYLQRLFGYSLLGSTREQSMFFHVGKGGDGKSTTMNTIARIAGDYAAAIDVELLLARRKVKDADAPKSSLASLSGDLRLAYASEPPEHAYLNEGLIKQLTGGAPIKARFNYQDPFEFQPRFKINLECNTLPLIKGIDDGIWRRIRVIPWPVQIPRDEQDVDLDDKLFAAEAPGILNWLVEGARQYLQHRLPEPPAVRDATRDYRKASNSVLGWIEECIEFRRDGRMAEADLWKHYKTYCIDRGVRAVTRRALFEQLSWRGAYRSEARHSRTRRTMVTGCRIAPAAMLSVSQ